MNQVCCCGLILMLTFLLQQVSAAADDIVIRNASIFDGSGAAPITGHVAIKAGKITSVGAGPGPEAAWEIDATGLVVAPGFIDLHTHSDPSVVSSLRRGCVNYLLQGCTTSVTGNCGGGTFNTKDYYDKIDLAGAGTNVAHLFPQGTMRLRVVGNLDRKATDEELAEMRRLAKGAMDDGAWGMSTGLIYSPGVFSSTEELIEIAKVIAQEKGIYASHIRNEDSSLVKSVLEAIEIGESAGCPAHISHLKAAGTSNWGTIRLAIDEIERARQRGLKVTADQYPYIALSTGLEPILFPGWARSGGTLALVKRLNDPETASKVREGVSANLSETDGGGQVVIARCVKHPEYVGKSLKEIAKENGTTALQVAEEIVRTGGAKIVSFTMSEDDVRLAMALPWVATASDAAAQIPGPGRPHPRGFGTFPRKIGYYSIQEEVLPLAQAIRSSSGLPADIIGFTDRGYLKTGFAADIVVFDPKSFIDKATYEEPYRYAEGMTYVFVNGTPAVSDGTPTGALAGRALRKQNPKATAAK